jgi:hypothetical protein
MRVAQLCRMRQAQGLLYAMVMGSVVHRQLVRETLLALLVLALTFLNFGHSNAVFAAGGRVVVTTASFCGNPLYPADGDHTPCHACRIGAAAVLPPPPAAILPVAFVVVPVVYALPALRIISPPAFVFARPRAPPVTV